MYAKSSGVASCLLSTKADMCRLDCTPQ